MEHGAVMMWFLYFCALATVMMYACPAQAGEHRFVLREHLNKKWSRDLVAFPFDANRGECHRDSLTLDGPDGPVAFQLSDVELWPGPERFVKSARVWFIADLDPLATDTYTLRFGNAPVKGGMPQTDFRLTPAEDQVELSTSHFAARLLLDQMAYEEAVPAEAVPGPLMAMRTADGTWFGDSRLYGPTRITGYSARLTAEGPIFGEVTFRYAYAGGNTLELKARLAAGDNALLWDADVKEEAPEDGIRMILSRGLAPLTFRLQMEFFTKRDCFLSRGAKVGDWAELPLAKHPPGLITNLTPWGDWWDDYTQTTILLKMSDREGELQVSSRDAGAWVVPAAPGTMREWSAWHHKLVPLMRSEDGEVFLEVNNAVGERKWSIGESRPPAKATEKLPYCPSDTKESVGQGVPRIGRELNRVKDYVLDWESRPGLKHPHLFVTAEELKDYRNRVKAGPEVVARAEAIAREEIRPVPSYKDAQALAGYLASGDSELAKKVKLVERLRRHLGLLGNFDLMRHTVVVAALYDALADSGLVPESEKPVLRAQMAYLGYKIADPATWSIERGYRSGNPNMSVSYVLSLGIIGCLLPDHPQARAWARPAIDRMRRWLKEDVGPKGEWPESAHYSHVSGSMLVSFAVAARNAGFFDFFKEGRLKRFMLYLAKEYTPPDPQRGNYRVTPPLGRANSGSRIGLVGVMAKATANSDPHYSRVMQWVWKETGYSRTIFDDRFGGFEQVYSDPDLPAEVPDWKTELFPQVGVLMRHGVGTQYEHYVNILTNSAILFARPSEPGSVIKLFSKGRPIGGAFTGGYEHKQELLMSRVLLARSRGETREDWFTPFGYNSTSTLTDFAALPRLDYVCADFAIESPSSCSWWMNPMPENLPQWPPIQRAGKPPVDWRRQVLFLKDDDPKGANYLLFRDTVKGGQPTMWQFWTLSQKIGTPQQVQDLDSFLSDKPGDAVSPPRQLHGDRFTAIGQWDVDVEYYVASPANTPRYTLRYGTTYAYPVGGLREYQDLLHLQLPGDGHYLVAMFPRFRSQPVPRFETLGEGTVMKVEGEFGTDYAFLSDQYASAEAEEARFEGTAACVQDRKGGIVLGLGAKGDVHYGRTSLSCHQAVSVRLYGKQQAEIMLPSEDEGREVHLALHGPYKLAEGTPDSVQLTIAKGRFHQIRVPAGIERVRMTAR